MTENVPAAGWEDHDHEGLVHTHRHFHVTHNHDEMTGGFEHLSAAHEHDHAPLHYAHVPHQDFDREHAGEARVHDHDQPTAPGQRARAPIGLDAGAVAAGARTPQRPTGGTSRSIRTASGKSVRGRRQGHAASRVLTGMAVPFSLPSPDIFADYLYETALPQAGCLGTCPGGCLAGGSPFGHRSPGTDSP